MSDLPEGEGAGEVSQWTDGLSGSDAASTPQWDTPEEPRRRLLLVSLPEVVVALPADRVLEVISCRPYARVPGAPGSIAGVTNRRGRMLTVVDLGVVLGGTGVAGEEDHRVVVVDHGGREIGLAVLDVLQFASDWWSDPEGESAAGPAGEGEEVSLGSGESGGEDQLRVIEVETVLGPLFGGEDGVGEPTEGRS